jgi:hypothetical protein
MLSLIGMIALAICGMALMAWFLDVIRFDNWPRWIMAILFGATVGGACFVFIPQFGLYPSIGVAAVVVLMVTS